MAPEVSAAHMLVYEMGHDFAWLVFLSSLLSGAVAVQTNWLVRKGGVVLGGVLLLLSLLLAFAGLDRYLPNLGGNIFVMGSIATSL